ncbi:4-galactosyl-N-acetylglucosaminide 3-alpha-L-fucosyltransferase FUT6-like [Arctopsyche grandis]|uniref:4-galactosyl-N-acetylglucosaminide 3-alpha-L-fucosyltransferase FUT6-like n=1 Tax=Arctopsyche grandis TaxID=121162 RepID=UPI00406D6DD7
METDPLTNKNYFRKKTLLNKFFILFILVSTILIVWTAMKAVPVNIGSKRPIPIEFIQVEEQFNETDHIAIVEDFYSRRSHVQLSVLGNVLFRNASRPKMRKKKFKILIWKYGNLLKRRHLEYFQTESHDPFKECAVNNCKLSYNDTNLKDFDAVVFLLHRIKSVYQLPGPEERSKNQRWIFLTDESPWHTFLYSRSNKWQDYNGVFNWSMSYRMESDIPVPYGRIVPLNYGLESTTPLLDLVPNGYKKRRDVLVAIMLSNGGGHNNRMAFIKELQKYIKVDVYGGRGTTLKHACPGHFKTDCAKLNNYMFYLAFENSDCDEYMTEKLYWNAYSKGAIPIIMGATKNNCKMLLPVNSYFHVDEYAWPIDVARHLQYLNKTWNENIYKFHQWRRHFSVANEHGYFGSKSLHYCRICEALNYNDQKPKVSSDLTHFLSKSNCRSKPKQDVETNRLMFFENVG